MTEKNIWAVLRIKPTTDEKQIRKAYAILSKEVHPEEKPEEFKELYQAYKAALAYAKSAKGKKEKTDFSDLDKEKQLKEEAEGEKKKEKNRSGQEKKEREIKQEKETGEEKPEENQDLNADNYEQQLIGHFSDRFERQKLLIGQLRQQWEKVKAAYENCEFWQEYLASEDFKEVQWLTEALDFLAEETETYAKTRHCTPENDPLVALWKVYDFPKNRHLPQTRRIYTNIYPAFRFWLTKQMAAEERERRKRKQKLLRLAVASLFCFVFSIIIYTECTENRRYVEEYMREAYPGVAFSKPKKTETGVYTFYSKSHPEITITARIKTDGSQDKAEEDYGTQLLEHYSAEYGAKLRWEFVEGSGAKLREKAAAFGNSPDAWNFGEGSGRALFAKGRYVAYYENIEDAENFCAAIAEMFEKEKEGDLDFVQSFGMCAAEALYPLAMLEGGELGFPRPQHYTADELTGGKTLAASVREGYADYMYNYEAWNLSKEQKESWGAEYRERGRKWEEGNQDFREETLTNRVTFKGESHTAVVRRIYFRGDPVPEVEAVEQEQDLYIPLYCFVNESKLTLMRNAERYISVGNLYQLLEGMGMTVETYEDGSGFTAADKEGEIHQFGEKAEEKLNEVLAFVY